ncbi:MAG: sulfite exporter TauE/SafE family protein [Candidatus Hydrogenedentes bacterium]|nr:sulfite exporter TauE/SafE family protein [Candidatus Hydrogenedentota bacterium]
MNAFIEPGVPVAIFWLFVGVAIIIQGISKSGFAGGAGILSLPLMMLVMPVDKVAATLLPLLILCDFNAIYHHRSNCNWGHLRAIYLPSILGILAGALVWWWVGREGIDAWGGYIKRFTGVIAILFGLYILAKDRSMAWVQQHHAGRKTAIVAGVAAGFTSTIAHAAGPIVSLYMYSQGMGKSLFVGTVAWTFTLINLTKLPFYVYVDLIDYSVLGFDLYLVPLIPIGSWLGHWMHHRVPERGFSRVIMVLTLVSGVQLVFNVPLVQWAVERVIPLP